MSSKPQRSRVLTAGSRPIVRRRLAEAFDTLGTAAAWKNSRMSAVEHLLTASAADAVLNAVAASGDRRFVRRQVVDANVAAEAFFEVSVALLRRNLLRDLVPFGSPLLTLIEQVRPARRRGQ